MLDRQLPSRTAGGDEAALQSLLRRFTPMLRYILRPLLPDERDREECLADISLRIWQGAGSFDGAKGSLNGWLTALTRNAALNRARARRGDDVPLEDTVPHGGGSAYMAPAWRDGNCNDLASLDAVDPDTGFALIKTLPCKLEKVEA